MTMNIRTKEDIPGDCTGRIQLQYLFEDRPVPAGTTLSNYDTLDFVSADCHIYGQIMWPDGGYALPRPVVLLLHGFPGSARNDDIAHALCRAGCVVLTPHHQGAWGSEGEYLVTHCIEDAVNLAEHVRTPEFREKYNADPASVYLIGHSMGGNTALNAAKRLPFLRGAVLMTPFDPTRHIRDGSTDQLLTLSDQGSLLHWVKKTAVYEDILAHLDDLAFENAFDALKDQNLLCVTGAADEVAPGGQMFGPLWALLQAHETTAVQRLLELNADHGLLGCRVALIRAIGRFIADTTDN